MSNPQQQKPLDPKRLNAYATQFKVPFQNILGALNQIGPNYIDQLIEQCVILENQVKELREENDKLTKEKVLAKTIIKENETTNQKTVIKPISK